MRPLVTRIERRNVSSARSSHFERSMVGVQTSFGRSSRESIRLGMSRPKHRKRTAGTTRQAAEEPTEAAVEAPRSGSPRDGWAEPDLASGFQGPIQSSRWEVLLPADRDGPLQSNALAVQRTLVGSHRRREACVSQPVSRVRTSRMQSGPTTALRSHPRVFTACASSTFGG